MHPLDVSKLRHIAEAMTAAQWEHLLERGSLNEIRCALFETAATNPQNDELHYRLMDALEAVFERGLVVGKALVRQEFEEPPRRLLQ
jgi:hypothetical protein